MADVIVTFGRASGSPPVMQGKGRRTEVLTLSGSAATTTLSASTAGSRGENIVDILALGDCWVEIGPNPAAAAPGSPPANKSWPMSDGDRMQFDVDDNDKVSVIARS